MNNQTQGSLEADNGLIWPPTMDKPVAGASRESFEYGERKATPQEQANAALLAAAYTSYDKAGRELGIDALALAQSVDLASVIRALKSAKQAIQLGFDHEGDVYGINHNEISDTLDTIEGLIAALPSEG